MRIAITADWLVTKGGAERVIAEMLTLWPRAPLFTTVARAQCLAPLTPDIRVSRLQKLYRILPEHRLLIPFMPKAVESWDLRGYDVILSSSHAVAKGFIPPSDALHICYCHTPMRYAWAMEEEYLKDFGLRGPLRVLAKRELRKLRSWDLSASKRVDLFIANSKSIADRIAKIYGRESIVLTPPIHDRFFEGLDSGSGWDPNPNPNPNPYFLAVGRLVPYKKFDLLIETANAMKLPLKIAGDGPEGSRLRKMAGPTVEFLGRVSDEALPALYARARAVLFPVHEDAGLVPLEAQACGTPVIALRKGGALDTVIEGKTGLFFDAQTVEALQEAIRKFEGMRFDPTILREHAKQFSSEKFRAKLSRIVTGALSARAHSA